MDGTEVGREEKFLGDDDLRALGGGLADERFVVFEGSLFAGERFGLKECDARHGGIVGEISREKNRKGEILARSVANLSHKKLERAEEFSRGGAGWMVAASEEGDGACGGALAEGAEGDVGWRESAGEFGNEGNAHIFGDHGEDGDELVADEFGVWSVGFAE